MASIQAVLLCPTPVRSAEYKDGVSLTMAKGLIEHQRATQAESLRRNKTQVFSICLSCGYCRGDVGIGDSCDGELGRRQQASHVTRSKLRFESAG